MILIQVSNMSINSWIVTSYINKDRVPSISSNDKFETSGESDDKLMKWKLEVKSRRVHDEINIILEKEETLLSTTRLSEKTDYWRKQLILWERCHCNLISIISFHIERIKFHWWFWTKEMHTDLRSDLIRPLNKSCLSCQRCMKKRLTWKLNVF